MVTPDWREHATPEAQQAFADAQARLDEGDYPPGEAGREQERADEELTDRYDRLVLQPAQDEFERQRDEDKFNQHYPEPPDLARIEFEYGGDFYAAYRMDVPERQGGTWWLYGPDGEPRTWRQLVVEFQFDMDGVTVLVDRSKLTGLRDELQARLDDENRNRQIAVEYATETLDAIVGGGR